MSGELYLQTRPGEALATNALPVLSPVQFRDTVAELVREGTRLAALFGYPSDGARVRIMAVMARPEQGSLLVTSMSPDGDAYPALTPVCPQAHWFEREVAEQRGIVPQGHPWLKPIRYHRSWRQDGRDAWGRSADTRIDPCVTDFYRVEGEGIHEVAVGPVHAGVIEPGHFRFQCHGEEVLHLEIALGYQHRGVERMLTGGPGVRSVACVETLAGDTTIGHASAYSECVEALAGCTVPFRAHILRGVALELERLANHTGDLGALAGDVAFLPTASYCGRIRGDFLNMTALLCGNRFGRGLVIPGGTGYDVDEARRKELVERLARARQDVTSAVNLLWDSASVMARFEQTGVLSNDTCRDLGLVGVAARACGRETDARYEFPQGVYRFVQIPVSTWHSGDVFARAYVRWLEIQHSLDFVMSQMDSLGEGPVRSVAGQLQPDRFAVSLVEGWRGEIVHVAMTDASGRFSCYKVVDPSFHNWMGLAMALRNVEISDFPLCNKSFNLSYCGHDL